jgi:hypothetical protein
MAYQAPEDKEPNTWCIFKYASPNPAPMESDTVQSGHQQETGAQEALNGSALAYGRNGDEIHNPPDVHEDSALLLR